MMTQHVSTSDEQVSALTDGELRGAELPQTLRWLQDSEQAQARWHTYHVLGDILRSGEKAAMGAHDADFVARLRARLQGEAPLRHAEHALDPHAADRVHDRVGAGHHHEVANDDNYRWKLVAGVCSVAAAAVVGWQLMAVLNAPVGSPQLARVEVPSTTPAAQVMIRDPRLEQLLAAHQQHGVISAFQMPAGFLRNATYDRPVR